MVTKFNTGDEVLIPAKVRSAAEKNGQIIYFVDTDNIWDGISEENIILNENSTKNTELQSFVEEISERWR